MDEINAVQCPEFTRFDEFLTGYIHRMELSIEFFDPKVEKFEQDGIFWRQIVVLPDVCLEEAGVIGHVVEDLRRCEAVITQLQIEIGHAFLPSSLMGSRPRFSRGWTLLRVCHEDFKSF